MSALLDFIQKNGRAPSIGLNIYPINNSRPQFALNQFLNYKFSSSILIPVDSFSFQFTMPSNISGSITNYIQEGDIAELTGAGSTICTGIIDVVDIETTSDGGDVVSIQGRNLLSQLEDQSTVNTLDNPMWGNNIPLPSAVGSVIQNTRIPYYIAQGAPAGNFLFATSPGESKLTALQRFCEPLNCLIWGDPRGGVVVGRPNQGSPAIGSFFCDRDNRVANVMSIKAIRASTQIPNIILPVWNGQETVQKRVAAEQALYNPAYGPKRLRLANHNVQRCVVVSNPDSSDPQSLSDINAIKVGGSNILQAYALREMARDNMQELNVQVNVKSHYNDDLQPILIDQVYQIKYPRAGVDEGMYCYQVEYTCDASQGPKTSAYFCKLGTIVVGTSLTIAARQQTNSGNLQKL